MVEWANLKRFVRRVSETAMIDEADGGKHVQTLLLSGKLKARAPLLMKGGSIKPAEEMAIIPPHYWEEINVDWRKLNDPYGYDPDGGNYYEFFVGGEFYLASEIEILSTDARAFLRQLEHEDLPPVLPQAKNRGGRAATINWGGLAGHITAWTIDNGVPETAAPLVKEAKNFFSSQERGPQDDRALQHFASEFLTHCSKTAKRPPAILVCGRRGSPDDLPKSKLISV